MLDTKIVENVRAVEGIYLKDVIGDAAVLRIPGFLQSEQCLKLIRHGQQGCKPSIHLDMSSGQALATPEKRRSKTQVIHPENKEVSGIIQRIANVLCTTASKAEPANVICYETGGFFSEHMDAYSPIHFAMANYSSSNRLTDLMSAGNRTWTALIYLNHDFKGGCTLFPRLGISLMPEMGTLICWKNSNNSAPIMNSLHSGSVVERGEKHVIVIPFRERDCDQDNPSYYI